jgi:hypothetical protein
MKKHVQVLGYLNITFGALGLIAGIIIFFILIGAGLIATVAAEGDKGILAMNILSIIAVFVMGFFFLLSIPGIIAGIGLLQFKKWARILTIILAFFGIFNIPFGTALSIYTFWVLFNGETDELFSKEQD